MDRGACRSLEERFLSRFRRGLKEVKLIHNPVGNTSVETSSPQTREGSLEIEMKAAVRRHVAPADQPRVYDEMPRNTFSVTDFLRRRFFGRGKPVVAAAAAVINPLEDLARAGTSTRPAGPAELTDLLARITTHPKVFYYVAVFSPTGWDRAAHPPRVGSNYILALIDPYGGGFRVALPASAGMYSRRVFDLMSYREKFQMLGALLDECGVELILGDFTEDLVVERLHFSRDLIESLFEDWAANDPFLILDSRRSPIRLIREVSRGGFPGLHDASGQNELIAYRDAMMRDNDRVQRVLKDLEILSKREQALLNEGARAPDSERRLLAHQLRRIRAKHSELSSRLEIFQKRYRIVSGYVQTLEQIVAAKTETVPDPEKMESMMARAGVARDQIKELADLAEASRELIEPETSEEIGEIMQELESKPKEKPKEPERPEPEKVEEPAVQEPEEEEDEGMLLE